MTRPPIGIATSCINVLLQSAATRQLPVSSSPPHARPVGRTPLVLPAPPVWDVDPPAFDAPPAVTPPSPLPPLALPAVVPPPVFIERVPMPPGAVEFPPPFGVPPLAAPPLALPAAPAGEAPVLQQRVLEGDPPLAI